MASPSVKRHSKLGPSKAGRWLYCRASVGFIEKNAKKIPPEKPSAYAEEGKQAHDLGEKLLLGKKVDLKKYPSEMVEHCEGYAKYVRTQMGMMQNAKLYVEGSIPLYYAKEEVGTPDAVVVGSKVVLVDLKYGEGISVEAKRNPQLAIYLKSALTHLKIKLKPETVVVMVIYQPRAQDNRFVRKWEITMRELDEFCAEIAEAATDILTEPDKQKFHCEPETVCRFCPAKIICPTYAGTLLGDAPEIEPVLELVPAGEVALSGFPPVDTLSDDQIGRLIGAAGPLKDWLKEITEHAEARMAEGKPIPGTKLVLGRGSRDWSDEKKAFRVMRRFIPREECVVKTLLSPAQVEKRLKAGKLRKKMTTRGEAMLAALIEKKPGKPTLVHVSDPRPPIDAENLLGDGDNQEASLL